MFPLRPLVTAIALATCSVVMAAPDNTYTPRSLLAQAKGLPSDFEEHFFDVPLAVRVERDQQFVGEAMIVLTRDDRLTLLEFTDYSDSKVTGTERDTWESYLKAGIPLGTCTTRCPEQLLAVHYNLANSLVSILTENAERDTTPQQFYTQPDDGSTGLIINNQLNLNGGQNQDLGGRFGVETSSSLGNWSHTLNFQLARLGGPDTQLYHALYSAYAQREFEGQFLRLGYFTPNSEGLNRLPRSFGAAPDVAVGVMVGSSDSLAMNNPKPSIYPIYVTSNRQGSAEVYRNGLLINTQPVPAGLQTLDTRPLPGGIYEVEVRLIEDGQVTSTSQELVYKPNNWRNHDERWRYNLFAGRESTLLNNWEQRDKGDMTAGASLNYLLHPRVIVGLSGRQVQDRLQLGSSIDWTLAQSASVYANVYQTRDYGTGLDVQGLYSYGPGSVIVSHNRSWLDTRDTYETLPDGTRLRQRNTFVGQTSTSSLSINHRLANRNSINARVSHSQGNVEGVGLDLGWTRHDTLFGSDANWRLSLFDRASSSNTGNKRNRGVDLTLNLALGGPGESWSGSIGSRTAREGQRDNNASLTYRKDLKDHALQNVSVTALTDVYGVGLSSMTSFATDTLSGDAFAQRSSYNGDLTGGLNLNNTLAIGAQKMVLTSQYHGSGSGMIIDVETDVEGIALRADDMSGGSMALRPGRNFVPITAYKSSSVAFDFEGNHPPAATIQPARTAYHLNKGGVDYRKISVMRTVTVLGRLLGPDGQPLKGHHIINHASRGVSEVDGFFSMEMNAGSPTLEVRRGTELLCQFRLDPSKARSENDVLMIGELRCTPDTLADATFTPKAAG
ncbi:CS1-pili formation C-terminal domain-containing protein [Pseudomonas sp. ICMP 460]|uniref:CS1-pili formation C-terminal domain-containing protein n=1 Tax=Pseudomonas sp. ICMP 460 TaxID=1718917 RepID=UPI000C074B1B|nr:CS1-pili formation C-terminal domain-containing protein [Pseudomonas sp. ICMP 460]PHN26127.1 pilus assembly protein PapC [Pseudomonas sp. ICMP 460]